MELDLLAFGAHPDDVEITAGGTIIKHIDAGYRVGIIDLTRGELGTRGNAEIRDQEALEAAKLMGLSVRENLFIPDGFVELIRKYKMKVIETLRKFRPKVVLMPYEKDRHPDHGNCGKLVRDSCFLSGLHKIQTKFPPHKPSQIFYYFSLWEFEYSFIVDISAQFQRKIEAIKCFASQLYQENQSEPATMLSQPDFLELIENRARYYGYRLGVKYGEPFYSPGILKVNDLLKLETGPFTI